MDIQVNAAARPATPGATPRLAEITDDDMRAGLETKVLGYPHRARAFAPGMAEHGWSRTINISGRNAAPPVRNVSVAAMTKNLSGELVPPG